MLLPGIYLTADAVRETVSTSLDLLDRKSSLAADLGDHEMADAFHELFMLANRITAVTIGL